MNMTDVETALNLNKKIDAPIKENILGLVNVFHETFKDISLEDLCNNLKTLKIEKVSVYVNAFPLDYNSKLNKLTINVKELERVEDSRNYFMNIVIRIIMNKNGNIGFDKDEKFVGINIGYIAGIANMLVGNVGEDDFFKEEITACNIVGKLIGDEILKTAFFNHDTDLLIDSIVEKGE